MSNPEQFPPGSLAVVAVPLGNPGDVTLRALEILRQADLVAAEDTRTAARLLSFHGIAKPLLSYHDWNEGKVAQSLLRSLGDGARAALISEAGTPGISDPGYDVVRLARREGLRVFPVPGPSAFAAFLSVSGLPTNAFSFFGFPPNRQGQRRALFGRLTDRPETLVFYESPRRIVGTLRDALDVFGDREASLGREMTKPYEEFLFGRLSTVLAALQERPKVLGEVCWGIRGISKGEPVRSDPSQLEHAAREALAGVSPIRSVARDLAQRFGVPSKEVYALLVSLKGREQP